MRYLVVVALALLVQRAESTCYCSVENGTTLYSSGTVFLNNPADDDFNACSMSGSCRLILNSTDANKGWTGLTITWGSVASTTLASLNISDSAGNIITTIQQNENVASGSPKYNLISPTSVIFIDFIQTAGTPVIYGGSISVASSLGTTAQPTTTTNAPTTRTYPTNGNFSKDPWLISQDIFITIDQSKGQGRAGLNALVALTNNFVSQLSITNDSGTIYQTRLGLAGITPYSPNFAMLGQIWSMDSLTVQSSTSGITGYSVSTTITEALQLIVPLAFTIPSPSDTEDTHQQTRKTAQRTLVHFSAALPTDLETLNKTGDISVQNIFKQYGVNLLIVGYNLTSNDTEKIGGTDKWYSFVNVAQTDSNAIASFVNPFFLGEKKNLATPLFCAPANEVDFTVDGTKEVTFQEPYNYNGATGTSQYTPNDGQANRYCNFQSQQYTITNTKSINLKYTVFYELEIEKDFLRFYDGDREIESFTGYDVSGATFYSSSNITATFSTDNKAVYGGFYVSVMKAP